MYRTEPPSREAIGGWTVWGIAELWCWFGHFPDRQPTGHDTEDCLRAHLISGIDIAAWCRDGLIDELALSSLQWPNGFAEHTCEPYVELAHAQGIPVYAGSNCLPIQGAKHSGQVTRVYVEIAKWAVSHPNVPGIMMDSEMYGAGRASFPDACFCNACQRKIAAELNGGDRLMDLDDGATLATYRETSTKCTRRILEAVRKEVHAVYPRGLLGGYLLDHMTWDGFTPPFYKAMTLAWGTRDTPALVFSEATYQPGYHAAFARSGKPLIRPTGSTVAGRPSPFGLGDHPGYIEAWLERRGQWGAHAEFVGGLWINR